MVVHQTFACGILRGTASFAQESGCFTLEDCHHLLSLRHSITVLDTSLVQYMRRKRQSICGDHDFFVFVGDRIGRNDTFP